MPSSPSGFELRATTYRFTQKGVKMAGSGSMTFVMGQVGKEWKISSWT